MTAARKILVVEDDADLRQALVEQLALHDEFEPLGANTAAEAAATLKNTHVDLVLMDVGLPDRDGREALRDMRADGYKGPEHDRILLLDGLPNYQRLFSLRVGQTLREQFEADLQVEVEVVERLRPGITMCREKQDHVSANLFEKILGEEEHHIDYLQTQLALMDKIGEELYIAQCLSTPPS